MIHTEQIQEYVRNAAAEVFSTMLGMEIEAGEGYLDKNDPAVTDGVLSFVGLAGPWAGAGAISCTADFACKICAGLLMTEATSVNEEVLDAVGEVTNMVIGNFKTMAEQHLGPLGLSIPTVIFGHNFTSRSTGHNEWVVLPFKSDGDALEIRVCLAPVKDSKHAGSTHGVASLA